MSTRLYPGVIFSEPEGSTVGFSILFPDIPGTASQGTTLDQCVAMGQEALNLVLETWAEDRKDPPPASDVATARAKALEIYPEGQVLTIQLVQGALPGRAAKYTISMDEELMKRIDAAAGAYGRSGYIAEACREKLRATAEAPVFMSIEEKLTRALSLLEGPHSIGGATTDASAMHQALFTDAASLSFDRVDVAVLKDVVLERLHGEGLVGGNTGKGFKTSLRRSRSGKSPAREFQVDPAVPKDVFTIDREVTTHGQIPMIVIETKFSPTGGGFADAVSQYEARTGKAAFRKPRVSRSEKNEA